MVVDLSVVLVTYNRALILRQTLSSLRHALDEAGLSYEFIIADDCSDTPHRELIDSISDARVVRTMANAGLGANVNNGLAAVRGRFVLQVQDDWTCVFGRAIVTAMRILEANRDIGIVQLTEVNSDTDAETRYLGADIFRVFRNDRLPWRRRCSVRPYSDQPHVKRREVVQDIGLYLEGVPMTECENDFKKRVARQTRWRVAMLKGPTAFVHSGEERSLNPGNQSNPWVQLLRRFPLGRRFLEPSLRRLVYWFDHAAARLTASL